MPSATTGRPSASPERVTHKGASVFSYDAQAMLNRLLHDALIVQTNSVSRRLRDIEVSVPIQTTLPQ